MIAPLRYIYEYVFGSFKPTQVLMSYLGSSGWSLLTSPSAHWHRLVNQGAETQFSKTIQSNSLLSRVRWKFYRAFLKCNHHLLYLPLITLTGRIKLGSQLLVEVRIRNKWSLWSQLLLKKFLLYRTRNNVLPFQAFKLSLILGDDPGPVMRLIMHRKLIA